MYPTKPFLVCNGFKGEMGEPQQHSWSLKNEDQSIIMEGVGGTPLEAQNDLVSQLQADGWTDNEINETFRTYINKGQFQALP